MEVNVDYTLERSVLRQTDHQCVRNPYINYSTVFPIFQFKIWIKVQLKNRTSNRVTHCGLVLDDKLPVLCNRVSVFCHKTHGFSRLKVPFILPLHHLYNCHNAHRNIFKDFSMTTWHSCPYFFIGHVVYITFTILWTNLYMCILDM